MLNGDHKWNCIRLVVAAYFYCTGELQIWFAFHFLPVRFSLAHRRRALIMKIINILIFSMSLQEKKRRRKRVKDEWATREKKKQKQKSLTLNYIMDIYRNPSRSVIPIMLLLIKYEFIGIHKWRKEKRRRRTQPVSIQMCVANPLTIAFSFET